MVEFDKESGGKDLRPLEWWLGLRVNFLRFQTSDPYHPVERDLREITHGFWNKKAYTWEKPILFISETDLPGEPRWANGVKSWDRFLKMGTALIWWEFWGVMTGTNGQRAWGRGIGMGGEVLTYFDISLHLTGCLAVVFLIQRRSELV